MSIPIRAPDAGDDGAVAYSRAQWIGGHYTAPEMSYRTLIAVLRWARDHAREPVTVCTDQEILTRQIAGEWGCRSERLRPLRDAARALLDETGAHLRYVPARENHQARILCRLAANQARGERGGRVA
ncbi:MAG: reverse transcriptase-like protein [Acidobacteriota bacterium]